VTAVERALTKELLGEEGDAKACEDHPRELLGALAASIA
jgi:hypothetical protein